MLQSAAASEAGTRTLYIEVIIVVFQMPVANSTPDRAPPQ